MRTKLYKVFTAILLLLSIIAGLCFYSRWCGMRDENNELKAYYELLISRRDKLEDEKNLKDEYYNRLMTDSEFSERVIREKLGYAYPNDIVFRFKDSEPVDENEDHSEKSERASAPEKKPSIFEKLMAFFGKKSEIEPNKIQDNEEKSIAPEFRVDMTNASIAAVENKARMNAQNAPSISLSNSENKEVASTLPENVSLLSDNSNANNLKIAKTKSVKIKLGGTNKNVSYANASAPKNVRFLSR